MKITGWHYLIGVLVVLVIFTAALLGVWIGLGGRTYRTIADGIIIQDDEEEHESIMLTAYTEYTDLLSDLGIARDVFLTSGDFDEYDYKPPIIHHSDNDPTKSDKNGKDPKKAFLYFISTSRFYLNQCPGRGFSDSISHTAENTKREG